MLLTLIDLKLQNFQLKKLFEDDVLGSKITDTPQIYITNSQIIIAAIDNEFIDHYQYACGIEYKILDLS